MLWAVKGWWNGMFSVAIAFLAFRFLLSVIPIRRVTYMMTPIVQCMNLHLPIGSGISNPILNRPRPNTSKGDPPTHRFHPFPCTSASTHRLQPRQPLPSASIAVSFAPCSCSSQLSSDLHDNSIDPLVKLTPKSLSAHHHSRHSRHRPCGRTHFSYP